MIFAGPCSPRFTADTLVVSVNVGEGGAAGGRPPGEALRRFPCEFVVIVKGRRGRDFGIGEWGFGGREREREEGLDVQSKPSLVDTALRFGRPRVVSRAATLRAMLTDYRL